MRHPQLSPPVVLVAHGSPDPRSAPVVRDIAAAAGAWAAFLDFDSPSAEGLLGSLAAAGHERVTVVPLLLTDAYHRRVDIPRVVRHVLRDTGMECAVTQTVGGAGLIPALVRTLPRPCDAVVLAAAGSRSRDALTLVEAVASQVSVATGLPCRPAYAAAASPTVPEAIEELRRRGAESVVVVSYFIAPGRLHDRIGEQAREAGCPVGPVLGACSELVSTVIDRYSSAVSIPSTPSQERDDRATSSTAVVMPRHQAATPQPTRSA